ncbi:MAG: trypsin-like peptidase domain-containing protein [Ignavibacteriota bacterium]|nr:trypsin-like peptidase domain-containing protein [Ignavibacteriota bacterium]
MTTLTLNTNSVKMKITAVVVAALLLLSGVVIGGVLFSKFFFKQSPNVNTASFDRNQKNENISQDRQTAITRAIEKVSNSIVGINVEEVREVRDPFMNDPFFQQFFGQQAPQRQTVRGLGSGFIISEDGYILTNDHVAGNATKISVTLTTGETIEAKLIGSDPVSDVALLKINKSGLTAVKFGNSDNAIIGEWVIALGNPFGLFEINDKPTVTVGVISALNMKVSADANRSYKDMIQTDASINSGNSGGPLINADGEVIGMNTIIYTGGQFNQGSIGVGFSISINRVNKTLGELKTNGKIERSNNVGFRIQGIDDQVAKYLGLKNKDGVVVTQVQKGGDADNAGLKPEDVILNVNGMKVRNEQDLVLEVNDLRVGDVLKMKIVRGGSEKEIEMKLTSKK